jgi:hypothetical protein
MTSVDDYIKRREESSGVVPTLCALAWGYGIRLPESVWDHEAMQAMTREVTIGVALYNDIVSLKKELQHGVDNIVPVLVFQHDVSPQVAVDMTIKMLEDSYADFLSAVDRLEEVVKREHDDLKPDIQVWIDGCLDVLIGNIAWSVSTSRYLPKTALTAGGSGFKVVL